MLTYVLRRLFLMIPTLIGMTFLVFMLIALSPGGIGAGLNVSSGGQMEAGSVAQQRAYIEERYGLDAPAPVQYVRWLGRVSPIKFGVRDQIERDEENPDADVVRHSLPRPVKPIKIASWLGRDVPEIEAASAPEGDQEQLQREYALAQNDYAVARGRLLSARTAAEVELGEIFKQQELGRYVRRDGRTETGKLGRIDADAIRSSADPQAWAEFETTVDAMVEAYEDAASERERVRAIYDAGPFNPAGVAVIPGHVTLDWPDLGNSFTKKRPVSELIAEALPVTLILNAIAIPIIYFVAVPAGVLASVRRGGFFDLLSGMFFIALWSVPIPLAGVLLQGIFADKTYLFNWFPVSGLGSLDEGAMQFFPSWGGEGGWQPGWLLDRAWHVVLPVLCLVYTGFAVLSKQTRAAMLENFNADYVRTAKAKGVASGKVVTQHVFRNSLLPIITMFVAIFPAMLAGSVVVENIFDVHGMGRMVIESIAQRDREVLLANTLIIGLVNMLALLLADILYAAADPRITYD